jgi:hypothetical protein
VAAFEEIRNEIERYEIDLSVPALERLQKVLFSEPSLKRPFDEINVEPTVSSKKVNAVPALTTITVKASEFDSDMKEFASAVSHLDTIHDSKSVVSLP